MKKLFVVFIVLGLCMAPAAALADNVYPPGWVGADKTLHAEWDVSLTKWKMDNKYYADVADWNPPGLSTPYLSPEGIEIALPDGLWIPSGEFTIYADNFDCTNPYKEIRVQLTYFALTDIVFDIYVGASPTPSFVEVKPGPSSDTTDHWTTAAFDILIKPNPNYESITFVSDNCLGFTLGQVVLDTHCYVPIPGAVWLLGSGLLCLIGIRRRFKN